MPVDIFEVALQPQLHIVRRRVILVGVGGLDKQNVRTCRILEVAQYRLVGLPEVAGEQQPVVVAVVALYVELHKRGAEDVPRVEELERYAARYLAWLVHVGRHEELHQGVDVAFFVERLEELLAVALPLLVYVFQVALLQKARIAQHHVAQLRGGLAGEHAAPEALPHQLGQVARVVYVRMGQYHIVYSLRIYRQVAVLLERFLAMALIKPAVEQYPFPVRLYEMHRSRSGLRRTIESYSHTCIIPPLAEFRQRRFSAFARRAPRNMV